MNISHDFSKNLKLLCSRHHSIAQICRDIGINRQQFNRYLNRGGMPSAHNLFRIARYFVVSEEELMMDHNDFRRNYEPRSDSYIQGPMRHLAFAFQSEPNMLRRYLGFYFSHFCSPSWPKKIMRSLVWLSEEDGYIVSHSYERAYDDNANIRQKTRYAGLAAYREGRIYIIEKAFSEDGFLSETILFTAQRQKVQYLRGMTLGVAAKPSLEPYSSPTIWKKIPEKITAREAVSATGIFDMNSTNIDPIIRDFLINDADKELL